MFILFNNQTINSGFRFHGKLKVMHSHCHMKTLHCMKLIYHQVNTWTHQINTLGDKKTAMQSEGITLKYKVNHATLLSLPLKIKIAATEHLEGWKTYFFLLWKV